MNCCSINNLKEFKLNPNWLRVGILPYYKINNTIYLLLGIYKVSYNNYEICALSGGFKRTIETIENGAYREFNEETEQFFSEFESDIKHNLIKSPILFSKGKNGIDRILFIFDISKYIKCSLYTLKNMFKEHFKTKKNTELFGIDFIEINKLVNNYCDINIYNDLINFMKKNNIYKNCNLEKFINLN